MFPAIHRNTRVIVHLNAIKQNIKAVKDHYPNTDIFAVVKANAYGHGMIEVAKAAHEEGVAGFCVALLDEAIQLRQEGFQEPILILGISRLEDVPILCDYRISTTVSSLDWLEKAQTLIPDGKQLIVHLAIDTGMGRIGVQTPEQVQEIEQFLREYDAQFIFEGIFTHFATADEADTSQFEHQLIAFNECVEALEQRPTYVHCSNSAAAIWHERLTTNVIRWGIGLYGLNPSNGGLRLPDTLTLEEALTWETEIVFVKQLHTGDTISYGATYTCSEDEWIATLPVGYADGYLRAYAPGEVIVSGVRCPIVGRVCMDQCMIRLPYEMPVGTKVTLLGKNGNECINAEELSHRSHTISYESLCLISDRVPRSYK